MKIAINTRTNGKFTRKNINGRSHLVTSMRPIRGDIAMNKIFYPNKDVKESFTQLHDLPAPNGHPKINNVHVSAFKPASMNAFNIGGWVRNPKMKGKEVFTEFVLDETVANLSEDGRELIKRIENGEKVGVSTGLNINELEIKSGKDEFGQPFDRIGHGFHFDHVAILLNEKAAGEHAGTEMILNTEDPDNPIYVTCVDDHIKTNELSADDIREQLMSLIKTDREDVFRWVVDIFPESKQFLFKVESGESSKLFKQSYASGEDEITLVGSPVEVVVKKEIKPVLSTNEDQEMNKDLIILSIIANAHNAFTNQDKERLEAMSESQLVDALSAPVDESRAKEVLTNAGYDFDAYDNFKANETQYNAFVEAENKRIDEIKQSILKTNSDYTDEMLDGKSEDELKIINKMIEGTKTAARAPEGAPPAQVNSAANADLNFNF